MLTLPAFTYHAPSSVSEAVGLLAQHGLNAKLIAGGTDLLPNMKHRLFTPEHVVGLKGISELHTISETNDTLRIGSMTTVADVSRNERVKALFPSLARAAGLIAGPQLREMGTLGGNVALDTRCVYYNQTYFWRKALGYCLKKDGTVCHVVKGGQNCVAAASNDSAPVLLTLGASVRLVSPRGERTMPLDQFFVADGIKNTVLEPDELIVEIVLPIQPTRTITGYEKLRIRAAIDYPALCVAVAATLGSDRTVASLKVVVSALGSRPHVVKRLEPVIGRPLDDAAIAEVGETARKQCHPLTNINVDTQWRRVVIPVMVRRAFQQALRSEVRPANLRSP